MDENKRNVNGEGMPTDGRENGTAPTESRDVPVCGEKMPNDSEGVPTGDKMPGNGKNHVPVNDKNSPKETSFVETGKDGTEKYIEMLKQLGFEEDAIISVLENNADKARQMAKVQWWINRIVGDVARVVVGAGLAWLIWNTVGVGVIGRMAGIEDVGVLKIGFGEMILAKVGIMGLTWKMKGWSDWGEVEAGIDRAKVVVKR